MTRKDKLIIDLLDEVYRLEKTIECYKQESVIYKDKRDKEFQEVSLYNENLKLRIMELEYRK